MRVRLHNLIFLFMFLGVVVGLVLAFVHDEQADWFVTTLQWLDFFGRTVFVGLLKMIIAPLILVSIVAGVTSIPSCHDAGRLGVRTLVYYLPFLIAVDAFLDMFRTSTNVLGDAVGAVVVDRFESAGAT